MDPKAEKRKNKSAAKERRAKILLVCLLAAFAILTLALLANACR